MEQLLKRSIEEVEHNKSRKLGETITTRQAAEIIGCDRSTVLRYVRQGVLPGVLHTYPVRHYLVSKARAVELAETPAETGRPRLRAVKPEQ